MITLADFRRNTDEHDINKIRNQYSFKNSFSNKEERKWQCKHKIKHYYRFDIVNHLYGCVICRQSFNGSIKYYIYCAECTKTFARDTYDDYWITCHSECLVHTVKVARNELYTKEAQELYVILKLINKQTKLPTDVNCYIISQLLTNQIASIV